MSASAPDTGRQRPPSSPGAQYKDLELIPVEIAIQRGFFTYFVEDREVFRDSYGQALRLLMERDECDARRAREEAPRHTAARPGHRV